MDLDLRYIYMVYMLFRRGERRELTPVGYPLTSTDALWQVPRSLDAFNVLSSQPCFIQTTVAYYK